MSLSAWNIPGVELRVIEGMEHDLPVALAAGFADAINVAAGRAKRA